MTLTSAAKRHTFPFSMSRHNEVTREKKKKMISFIPRNYSSLAEAIEEKKINIEISKLRGTFAKRRRQIKVEDTAHE